MTPAGSPSPRAAAGRGARVGRPGGVTAGLAAAAALVVVGSVGPAPGAAADPVVPTSAVRQAGVPAGSATGSPVDPVPWRWWDGAAYQLSHGLSDPPALNRDDCRPTADHPHPVILVHGTGLNGGNSWATLGTSLAASGYCVWAPTVGALPGPSGAPGSVGGFDSLTGASAPQLTAEIDRVLRLTGAEKVDLVGHSQGAIIASFVAATSRPDVVRTVVTLGADPAKSGEGPPEFVTAILGVLSSETTRRDADATLAWLGDEGVPFARGVRYVAVVSDYDELTGPVVAPEVPGYVDLRVARLQDGCEEDRSGHLTVLTSPRAVDLVDDALSGPSGAGHGTDPRPPRCVPSDQLLGVLAPVPPR